MMMKLTKLIATENEMYALGAALARHCPSGAVIYLYGELGAGKTTLVRGFLRQLGHKGTVKSPTYTLIEPYEFNDALHICHVDLYRLEQPHALDHIGLSDYLYLHSICLIEWPEKAEKLLPIPNLRCFITVVAGGREVNLRSVDEIGSTMLSELTA